MILGKTNNCIKCLASYSSYKIGKEIDGDYKEKWCEAPVFKGKSIKKPKGLCQFCNPKSIYYLKKRYDI